MRIVSRHFASIVLGLSLAAGTAWAQQAGGGNPVVERFISDTYGNSFVLDTNHPFTNPGAVTSWEIYADNNNPVLLVIYRQNNGSFVEVGRSPVVTPVVGYNRFLLTDTIRVKAGDFVGAHFPGSSGGSISFSVDAAARGEAPTCYPPLGYSSLFAFGDSSTAFSCSQNRHYSLRALIKQNQE